MLAGMDIFGIASSGMAAATARLNLAASHIASAGAQGPIDPVGPVAPPAKSSNLVQFGPPQDSVDLGLEMVNLTTALDQFKANVRVFEAGDKAMKAVLNIKA
jgi:flagellar basal body rod protein FlgC